MTAFSFHNIFIFVSGVTENMRYGETFFFTKSCIASILLCYTMIIFVFFKRGCSRLGGCRVLKSLIAVFLWKKSRYGETLN